MSEQEQKRVFELSDEQVAAIRGALAGCGAGWRLLVRTWEGWDEEVGLARLLLTSGGQGAVGGIEGFELGIVFEPEIEVLPDLGVLDGVGVTFLRVASAFDKPGRLTDLRGLSALAGLQSLDLSWCSSLEDVSVLSTLTGLQSLNLPVCESLKNVSVLSTLTGLQSLDLSSCKSLADVSGLSTLTGLQSLDLGWCSSLEDVSVLSTLTGLQSLDLSNCKSLEDVSVLSTLTGLQSLDLSRCKSLTDVSGLSTLTGLQSLDLSRCESLTDVTALSTLTGLQSLFLSGCKSLTDVSGLSTLTGLQSLGLSECMSIADVSVLSTMNGLQTLDLSYALAVTDVSCLSTLAGLQRLSLGNVPAVTNAAWLSTLTDLQSLSLSRCPNLTKIKPLVHLQQLRSCDLSGSGNIRDLDTLSTCAPLRELSWTETPACHAVLAATAVLRCDAPYIAEHAGQWLDSIGLSKIPDTFLQRLVAAFALGSSMPWGVQALTDLVPAARARGLASEGTANELSPDTWARWAEVVLDLGDPTFRPPFEAALGELDPQREVLALLSPLLTALADIPTRAPEARDWAVALVEQVLAPLVVMDAPARDAAPAAAVFYAAFGRDEQVRAWLDRGTHPHAPRWRDRVLVALQAWAAGRGDLDRARRWLAEVRTPELRDQAHAALARALAASAPEQAVGEHLEAIEGEALRTAVAADLAHVPAVTGTVEGLYGLLLTLQETPDAMAEFIEQLILDHPDSPLVADIARTFDASGPDTGQAGPLVQRLAVVDLNSLATNPAAAFMLVAELKALATGGAS
jgi:Leucine-rich repeat (LRR) protein